MTRDDQKERERKALCRLLKNPELVGDEVLHIEPDESPDFLLTLANGKKVGVEIVELVDQDLAKGVAGFERFEKELLDALKREGLDVAVRAFTAEGFIDRFNDPEEMQRNVAAMLHRAREHVTLKKGHEVYDREQLRTPPDGAPPAKLLREVIIDPAKEPQVWSHPQAATWGLSPLVQVRIEAKNRLLESYRAKVHGEVWLVLVAGTRVDSGSVHRLAVQRGTFTTKFDRLFYVEADLPAFELTKQPASPGAQG